MQNNPARRITPNPPESALISMQDMDKARATLSRVFGYGDFRPGQEAVLERLFAGEDVLAIMPTGSGKSLLYQIPGLVRPGLTVVISPLIALMRDQVRQLKALGVAAGAMNSSQSQDENGAVEDDIRSGKLRLLYLAPERLANDYTLRLLRNANTRLIAIDEAHCVSQWGHDFRPDYLNLRDSLQALGKVQMLAVTATADERTREEIAERLFPDRPNIFVRSFDRPNLRLAMRRKKNAVAQISSVIDAHPGDSGIVYCLSRKGTETLAAQLSQKGLRALPYHAGLDSHVRALNQDRFLGEDGVIMCATIAFGMGIDKPDVRFVCHANLPGSIEAYYQEIGRAGRDGLPASTLTLWDDGDVELRRRQIQDGDSSPERKRVEWNKVADLLALCETPRCRRQTLLAAFGEASGPCGNCDICSREGQFFDGKIAAQKVLSAMLRTSGKFFAQHLAKILTGEVTDAMVKLGHDKLKTFGVGRERSADEWRSIFHQLHAADLIDHDVDDDRWVMTAAGQKVLKGEADIELRMATPEETRTKHKGDSVPFSVEERTLYEALRVKRRELASQDGQPAFVIFGDRSLIDMVRLRPRTLDDMRMVYGVGDTKLERYGAIFLDVIAKRASGES